MPDRSPDQEDRQDDAPDQPDPPDKAPEPTPEQKRKKKLWLIVGAIALLVIVVLLVIWWIVYKHGRIATDDAYTDGRVVMLAAKVGGYVTVLAVQDNQLLKAGDLIVEIDPRDYGIAVVNAQATLDAMQAQADAARLERLVRNTSSGSELESARAVREQARASLQKARADLERQLAVNPLATTASQTDAASTQAATQIAQLRQAEAQLKTAALAPANVAMAEARVRQLDAQVESARAQLTQAQLNLSYTQVRAPQDGRVARRAVEVGSYLQPGQSLMALVSPQVWVTANYKENQLEKMRPGQPVALSIDAYPALVLQGHVDSMQMGSGSRFSAFPAENATGNFVKIVQRMPVKIVIDSGLDPALPMPLGASVVPVVDVR